jgi:molybdopterin converting factor small subunit
VPILVKLYGKLKENLKKSDLDEKLPLSIKINPDGVHSVYDILEKFAINEEELSHIFVNSKYCGIDKEVNNGDRVGLFPKNMALLFVEILPEYS